MGLPAFLAEVESRLGWKFAAARPFAFASTGDTFGWQTGEDGCRHFTVFIENGRVQDSPGKPFKTGMAEIAKVHKGTFVLSPQQHAMIANVMPEDEPQIQALLEKYGLDNVNFSALRLTSSACVAMPTYVCLLSPSPSFDPTTPYPFPLDGTDAVIADVDCRWPSLSDTSLSSSPRSRRSWRKRASAAMLSLCA
jgi:sulfite reductase (NADPH) hemoprotein beta-component